MKYPSLTILIEKLKSSPRVKGVFTTGTTASRPNPASDIDLVVVLDKNSEGIKSVYTIVENRFADIFFFDVEFVSRIENKREVSASNFEGMFAEWLAKGKIEYDPEGILLSLKSKFEKNPPAQKIPGSEKRDFWIKTNYNFIANLRYYDSGDKLYHQALELRLLYSVVELFTAYFSFRGIPWRGEKAAVEYLGKNNQEFLSTFQEYLKSEALDEKMKRYRELFNKVFFDEYQKWEGDFVVPVSNQNKYGRELAGFWDGLMSL